ncbi:MAG: signal peptidase I, partial [Paludibacteraceae bacterium]|nr:signal peptidase I [Paludibacteraceae bacterium]
SMAPTINAGDVIIVKNSTNPEVKDIITYKSGKDYITHRVVESYKGTYVTKGDANKAKDEAIKKDQVVGKVIKVIPKLGVVRKTILNPIVLITLIITMSIISFMFGKDNKNIINNIIAKFKKKRIEKVEPIVEDTPADDDTQPIFRFIFHNTPCSVHFSNAQAYVAPDASEQSAASGWEVLSAGDYDITVNDCIKLRDELQLGDWGYIKMLQALTVAYCVGHNEAVLMQMYILTQSGYKVRIARTGEKWVLLMPCSNDIYGYSYIYRDDLKYYILDTVDGSSYYYVFDKAFPKEQQLSLQLPKTPKLAYTPTGERTLASSRYPNMRVSVTENKNLIDFYNEYPLSSKWEFYSQTSLSDRAKDELYPTLRQQIAGKPAHDAANMLINFVQTAFDYKTDQEQFGYERPLFGDEILYYPYSDCEDRSILYSILVHELLGLDVVLVELPGHLATAVRFPNDEVYGYHYNIDGAKYTVCDPTYINADVGDCMPQFRETPAKIIQIN